MKITFLSLGLSTDAIGPRILSSLLKKNGYDTQLVFLPTVSDLRRRVTRVPYHYSENILNQIIELCEDSDLVGISLMTHHATIARDLTRILRKSLGKPMIWGGIHPTVCPEECLETADMVCVGEGEFSLVKLAERMQNNQDLRGIPGIWSKQNGQVLANGPGPLAKKLDVLPFPDYSFLGHHLLVEDEIHPMTPENWHRHLLRFFPPFNRQNPNNPAYQVLSARGCPFKCTFCGETPLTEKTYGRSYFRKRSIENLMDELGWATRTFPFIGEICFCDDTFASRSLADIEAFTEQYKRKIGLPFYILVSPANVTKPKFDLLVGAGLTHVGMGIQSGSERIIDSYDRTRVGSVQQSLMAAQILNHYRDCLLPYYDFIVENPYETREDLLNTIRLLIQLPRPYKTRVYALSFFPGTPLHEKASADGMLHDGMYDKTFGQRTQGGYLNLLVDMNKYMLSQFILRILISKLFLYLFSRPSADRLLLRLHQFLRRAVIKLGISQKGLS